MDSVSIQHLNFGFAHSPIFQDFNFSLPTAKWTALLGASGVGKSTLLRLIAGLESCFEGNITIKEGAKLAWLAQQDTLYPWLSVLDNVQLKAHLQHQKTAETTAKARAILKAVNMEAHQHKPCYQLSGGQRQRVALARTLMLDADIILMDEPFSALDAVTRLQLQQLAHQLLANKTVLLITHDPQEALRLCDQIFVLRNHPVQLSAPIIPPNASPRFKPDESLWALEQQLFDILKGEA